MIQKRSDQPANMRLDKWLWCARFFKTRGTAANAVKSGKVIVNNERIKPSKLIHTGDTIKIRQGPYYFNITIKELTKVRKSASDELMYEESPESIKQREIIAQNIKTQAAFHPHSRGRPGKRERRELIKYKGLKFTD